MEKRTQTGFTLYELLITVLIVGVILTFAVPNMQDFARNSRMTATANDLHAAFHLARSESSRAKTNISICPSDDGADCGGTWPDGYIVFVDDDGDLTVDAGTDSVLRQHGAAADGITLRFANSADYFSYSSTGLGRSVAGNTAVTRVVMCDDRGNITAAGGNSAARLFVVTPLGRATIIRDEAMIETALTDMDETCP